MLDDLGLAPALRAFAEARMEGSGTRMDIEVCNLPEHLPPDVEITLFRILQEGLSNAARYASASHVYVRVEQFAAVHSSPISRMTALVSCRAST